MSTPNYANLDLDAIRARAEAATEGPWFAWDRAVGWNIVITRPEDAAFIAAARTDVPALLAEVERLREALAASEAQVERVRKLAQK